MKLIPGQYTLSRPIKEAVEIDVTTQELMSDQFMGVFVQWLRGSVLTRFPPEFPPTINIRVRVPNAAE